MFGIIALVAFWVGIAFLWSEDGPKIPIIFIILWLIGFFGLPRFGLSGFSMPYEAILAIIVLMTWKVKSSI